MNLIIFEKDATHAPPPFNRCRVFELLAFEPEIWCFGAFLYPDGSVSLSLATSVRYPYQIEEIASKVRAYAEDRVPEETDP